MRAGLWCWSVVLVAARPGVVAAQDFAGELRQARVDADAGRAAAALARLLPLVDRVDSVAQCEELAHALHTLGQSLLPRADFARALQAHEAGALLHRRVHGDRDHAAMAASLNCVAFTLQALGRFREALPLFEQELAMQIRLHGERDHAAIATGRNNVAYCLEALGRAQQALPLHEAALAMRLRLHGGDHEEVAISRNNLAACLMSLGQGDAALPHYEQALAIRQRSHAGRDHPMLAASHNNLAHCLARLGRHREALPAYEQALAMQLRLHGDRDHPDVANALGNTATCLDALGRAREAQPLFERALASHQRLHGDRDHPDVARSLNNVAHGLRALGDVGAALPRLEQCLAMLRRLHRDQDHAHVAAAMANIAQCLQQLGRDDDALVRQGQALEMTRRLHGQRDHPDVAARLDGLSHGLAATGRYAEALAGHEQALAMRRRLFGGRDHPAVAASHNLVAFCLLHGGRLHAARAEFELSLAMWRRLLGDHDHPAVAGVLGNLASCLLRLDQPTDALPLYQQAVAMEQRLYADVVAPEQVVSLANLARCLEAVGSTDEAMEAAARACDGIERLRSGSRLSWGLQQSYFDHLKRGSAFELLQRNAVAGDVPLAFAAAERSRGRDLLDLLEQQRADPLHEAERRAAQRGDEAGAERLRRLGSDLATAEVESDRLLHALTRLDDALVPDAERKAQRRALLAESEAVGQRRRQLLDERARRLADVLPVGRVRTAAEIQAALRDGELLLEFTVTTDVALLYVLAREGVVAAVPLPAAFAAVQRLLPGLLARSAHTPLRGRDPEGEPGSAAADAAEPARELFAALIPEAVWSRLRASRRVFVAAHRELHRLPFELLVTEVHDGRPVRWLENGPPVAYVPSGSALHWLRQRAQQAGDDATALDLLAVGDPGELAFEPEVPEHGVFVLAVQEGGEGARVGLQPGDVLVHYDGQPLVDDKTLRDLRMAVERAVEDGQREPEPIPLQVWRRGAQLDLQVRPGLLGIEVGQGKARAAREASLGGAQQLARITRAGDVERLRRLPPLRGARAETEAIEGVFARSKLATRHLLGADATEPMVFDLAAKAKYLHFACHGVAEEYAGQSLSMLVLSPPLQVLPGDDGLLKLGDLLHAWRGRLASSRLVVLSACRTNVGPTLRDEAPQALPLGFLFAGAPAVISSLWAVDDASTKELMTDFYQRLLAGEQDQLAAFTAAKRALAGRHPDPFHWAPFLYLGSP